MFRKTWKFLKKDSKKKLRANKYINIKKEITKTNKQKIHSKQKFNFSKRNKKYIKNVIEKDTLLNLNIKIVQDTVS